MPTLIAFAVAAGVGAGLVWLVLKGREIERQNDFQRRVLARKQGWDYQPERAGRIDYRFTARVDGFEWQMWYDSDRGDKSPTPRAHWHCANVRTEGLSMVILGRRRFETESGTLGRLLIGVASGVVQAMSGSAPRASKAEFYESAVEVRGAAAAFTQRWAVAVAPEMPTTWCDAELQALLLDWPTADARFVAPDSVEATLQHEGLRIVVDKMPQQPVYWAHLARLGEALARGLVARGSAASPAQRLT
jgi:hypothetical protein